MMAVYVDVIRGCVPTPGWPWSKSCHLWADSEEELHALAARIGLRREWAQRSRTGVVHYDLTPKKRAQAIRAGASDREIYGRKTIQT